ncbi:helix-turn-helix transcriptional regulator [Paenibacillus sp. RUD330]|uniref:helix-turn-helix domain-containing protein n=1 Tax=Paenibacillus sp. RUD330 TaxID=2023772 RepID=UPI0012FD8DE4|nr:helix-turn-helix transcriptional regulator [Paenibacillus sp. RUD330]ASS66525.2 helix-turn-helix transcriptional regulator [Paenibacillus sp. RUD330]
MTNSMGSRVKNLRKKHGLSQEQLAARIGMTRSALGNYEVDRIVPSSDVLGKIALALQTSTDYLLGLTDSSMPTEAEVRFVDSLDLDNEELMRKFDLKINGEVIPSEHLELALGLLRSLQQQKNSGK